MIIPTRAVANLIHLVTLGASVIVQNGLVFLPKLLLGYLMIMRYKHN